MGAGKDKRVAMSILPVKVKSKDSGEAIQTYAMLDSGSTATFCSEQLMRDLRIEGKKTQILLRTMGQEKLEETYEVTGLEVSSLDGGKTIDLPPVWSQAELPVSKTDIVRSEDIERWKHLEGVPLPDIDSDIGLLIGINAPKAMEPHEVIPSEGDGPFAVRTKLGWVVNGPLSTTAMEPQSGTYTDAQVNRIEVIHTSTIQEQLVSQFNYDFSERSIDDVPEYSLEDKKFAKSVTGTIEYKDGHYTIGLPFRKEDIHMPNNRKQAEQRLKLLIRRFKENIPFYQDYKTFMNNIIQNGYARRVPEKELQPEEGKAWFLPHHGVYHRRKKKMRVVFDCAARYGGTSLNEQLLSGPNLTNNLVGILLRFRLGYIALLADIEAMFYQVRVPVADAGFLRFLWWEEGDVDKPVAEYQMTVHLFGATSSPSCSVFALLKTAEDNRELVGITVTNTLHHNFYVDDCLKSVDSVEEAVDLYHNLRRVCNKGGFNLTKWLSNERRIMEIIPSSEWASEVKNVDLDAESLPVERALGVQWRAETDQFEFIVSLKNSPTTRRGILSTVSSIYDPLGFLAPFILQAKQILQELCTLELGWDEEVPGNIKLRWNQWMAGVQSLSELRVNRCVKPPYFGVVQRVELHHFADASEVGYGVATYLRLKNSSGDIHCCLMSGKARVAPLKKITIPRLELTAATVAVRTDKMMRNELELEIPIAESYFWTDSMSVLKYIQNETSRFHTFVANRLEVIHEGTRASQWRYISGKLNPSDEASRGQSAEELVKNKRWLDGPEFLWKNECVWPEGHGVQPALLEGDPEVRKVLTTCVTTQPVESREGDSSEDLIHKLIEHHSSWWKLRKSVAWILKVKQVVKQRVNFKREQDVRNSETQSGSSLLSVEDLRSAENAIFQYTQQMYFADEVNTLLSNGHVKQKSTIRKLDPVLDEGLMRVGGRISRARLPEDSKHPVILPKQCHVSTLILRHLHQSLGHQGRNHMLSRLRQRIWIVQAPTAIRRVIRDCVTCRKQRSGRGEQKMSDLPTDRLAADDPPFTYTGVDYFGPFDVKRGRSVVKRYGVVFTCLTTRAIHLEVADSLNTSSYICALRRFVARRTPIRQWYQPCGCQ